MKFQKLINPLGASILLSFVLTGFMPAQQLLAQQKQPSPQKAEMKSMENMSMDKMMKECGEHHRSMTKSIDQMSKMMQDAKQSNDVAQMRSAMDQAQKQLSDMKEHMTMCTNMMNMMEKMQSMGGMMKDSPK